MDAKILQAALPPRPTARSTANGSQPIEHLGCQSPNLQAMAAEQICPACGGRRKVLQVVNEPPGPTNCFIDHNTRGRIVDCQVCNRNGQQQYLEGICGLTPEMRSWTYANTTGTQHNGDAYDYGQALVASPHHFYTLYGPFGTGKTRLLSCLVNAGRAHGWPSVYITTAELFDHLRSTYAPARVGALTFDGMWDKIANARILALDECDRFSPTSWATEKWFELVEMRYRMGVDHCTAFATNADIETLDGYLVSRMYHRESRVFELRGGDWRQ